ncbi:outer membrane protein assembly factor BamB [Marinobacterium arenosum]|uniref:outer membrane protein assembly factor BamB n=1 Tax=Marinobacterium arenosum TaxID=2862496 RepID=UPI001C978330|nr:outer membrane protein assembly factor BamB [Marinobacterium arenosum]MBY4678884.1 outer membrane protein assembly factor BamB [Marinobacterium arenosum]
MASLLRAMTLGLAAMLLSACSLWDSSEELEPNPLVDFEAEKQVEVLWSASVGDGPGEKYHQIVPAVVGEQLFAVDHDGLVAAFNRLDGERLWQQELDVRVIGGLAAGYGRLALTTEDGRVMVLDADSGELRWQAKLSSEVVAVPQFNRELLVVQMINGKVVALDIEDGSHRWTYDAQIPNLTLRGTSAPIVAANITFAGFANGKLAAIDNASGGEVWARRVALAHGRTELERVIDLDGRPVLVDNLLYVPSYQGRLVAINPFNSQIVWAQDVSSYRDLAEGFGNIYVAEQDDALQAFDRRTSASVWRQPALARRMISAPATVGNELLVGDSLGYLHVLSQVDGRFVARHKVDGSGLSAPPLVVDDIIYLLSDGGRLQALTLK